jgi:hypothetical protein
VNDISLQLNMFGFVTAKLMPERLAGCQAGFRLCRVVCVGFGSGGQ